MRNWVWGLVVVGFYFLGFTVGTSEFFFGGEELERFSNLGFRV